MPYENIPGVSGTYTDGSFRQPDVSGQPRVLILGSGESGLSNEIFRVADVREAEREFGAVTPLAQGLHEAVAQGAENLSVMRIGGRKGKLTLTDSAGGTLTITPEHRDNEVLDRYALALDGSSGTQRIGVYDLEDEVWVFDSTDALVLDEGVVDVELSGLDLFSVGSFTDATQTIAFSALVTGDFTADGTASMDSVSTLAGQDGQGDTLVEKYAALNTAYHLLDYKDADHVVPKGVYLDDANVADGDSLNLWAGPPLSGEDDSLGYVWQYIYQGKLYTYFVDSDTYFTDLGTATKSSVTLSTDLVLEAVNEGAGADGKFSLEIEDTGSVTGEPTSTDVTITETAGKIVVVVDVDAATSTTSGAADAINTALAAFEMSNGLLASDVLVATGTATVIAATEGPTDSSGGTGGNVATHDQLTGDAVPAAVSTRFAAGDDVELREVNFAHQLASFCHLASTKWSTMLGFINTKGPDGFARVDVAGWVGELPTYSTVGDDLAVRAGDDGVGLLGNKFLAGASGYRDALVTEGITTDGYAYGGFILTKGGSLPNGSDWPYGVDEGDEATDSNSQPVDIGKHIMVSYDWPVHRNGYNASTLYRGPVAASIAGLLATVPANEEPIGQNGRIGAIASPPRIHSTQLDSLAKLRMIGTRFESNTGYILVSAKTAAHPDSDYIRSSTIRSVNRELSGIRAIAKKYLGKAFSPENIVSLKAAIDGFLVAERSLGYNQGAKASVRFSRSDKILGKLDIVLRMVPPFSIEQIEVDITLAADESEL